MQKNHYLVCSNPGEVLLHNTKTLHIRQKEKLRIDHRLGDGYSCTVIRNTGKTEPCYVLDTQIEDIRNKDNNDENDIENTFVKDDSALASFFYHDNLKSLQETTRSKQTILQIAKGLKFPSNSERYSNRQVHWDKRGGHVGDKVIYRIIERAKQLKWKNKSNNQLTHPAYDIVTNSNVLVSPDKRYELTTYVKYGVAAYENFFSATLTLKQVPVKESSESICNQCKKTKKGCICPKSDQFISSGDAGVIGESTEVDMFNLEELDYNDRKKDNKMSRTNIVEAPTSKNAVAFKEINPILKRFFNVKSYSKEHQNQAFRVWVTLSEEVKQSALKQFLLALKENYGPYSYNDFMNIYSFKDFTIEVQGRDEILVTIFKKLKGPNYLKIGLEESYRPLPNELKKIENKTCFLVYPDLWAYYSDLFKSMNGFKPLDETITVKEVWDFIQYNIKNEKPLVCNDDTALTYLPSEWPHKDDAPHWLSLEESLKKVNKVWKKINEMPDISIQNPTSKKNKF